MDIPNLSSTPSINQEKLKIPGTPKLVYLIIIVLAVTSGFWISRFWPTKTTSTRITSEDSLVNNQATQITEGQEIKVGTLYGNTSKTFADSAIGVVKAGGISGEGTHTLEREGGKTQHAALTSSVIDLDLFIDKKVEVKGETNDSNKAGWLMDVGSIKILE
ncbi:MAG: hypothetical protein KIH89_004780 [Candidatus Shapirobacteria bacterium]|nr:hypothetical protein [Candidatus Shapirobacteria bacterium]